MIMKPFTNEILPQGYKMTELGALPEEWEVVVFEKCIKNEASKVGKVKQQEYKVYGKYPIIDQGQSLIAGYCDNEKYVYEGRLPVIIFGDHTRILKFINFPFVTGADGTKVLIPNTSVILPEFFYFALLNIKIPNRGYNRHYSLLREQKLPLPPLPEQKKIATVLSAMQEAKEKTQVVIDATKALKKSMMKHLFTYGPVPTEETENVPLKETEIGKVPEEWEVVKLGEVAEVKYGKANTKDKGNIPVVGSGGVYSRTRTPLVDYPTIVIGRKGTAGKSWLFLEPCYPSDTTFYLRWKKDIDLKFLYNYMVLNQLSGEHAKTTLPSLQKADLINYSLPLPPLPIQQKIASILSAIDAKIEAEENKKKSLEDLFKTLLHNLMTAKIRVHNLEIKV